MPHSRKSRPATAVAAMTGARRQLKAAREALAASTTPKAAPSFVSANLRWAQRLTEKRREALLSHPHVVGMALGSKWTKGADTGALCLTIFVSRKRTPETMRRSGHRKLPRGLRDGRRWLPIDVIPLGRLTRQAFAGQSCSVTNGATRSGTVGSPAVDAAGDPVLITAMHVTGRAELDPASGVKIEIRAPSVADSAAAPIIARVVEGSRTGIDAAKAVVLPSHTVSRILPGGIGAIRGWRPTAFPADKGIPVSMFGAASRRRHDGVVEHPAAFMPEFRLDSAVTVRGLATVAGDSGAALVDRDGFVLGFLVGATSSGTRVFTSAGLVLRRLGCDIPTLLD